MKKINICIAGLGNIGSAVIQNLSENKKLLENKFGCEFVITGVCAKNKAKKRSFNIDQYKWFDSPIDLINQTKSDIFLELIGEEKGISYESVKIALNNKIQVVTANKALLANHGNELFEIAEKNNVLILFEAAVGGGIPIIKTLKQSLFHSKIKKISGILNGTTNFILSEMYRSNSNFTTVLKNAQNNGFAESDPKNDIEGIDSAHKLSILSVLCFGVNFNFKNISYEGISNISNLDLKFADQLGYKIKLIASSSINNEKIFSIVEPTLVKNSSKLANVEGVQNGIKIETNYLSSLFIEGAGAGGKSTSSSIISDLSEMSENLSFNSLGYKIKQLKNIESANYDERVCSYYLRIVVQDIPGVLAKITSILNEQDISVETILQLPDNIIKDLKPNVPIIITTHETKSESLHKILSKIENLDFVVSKIVKICIDKNII